MLTWGPTATGILLFVHVWYMAYRRRRLLVLVQACLMAKKGS